MPPGGGARGLMARLQEKYRTEIVSELKKELKTDNIHALPRLICQVVIGNGGCDAMSRCIPRPGLIRQKQNRQRIAAEDCVHERAD